MRRSGKNGFLRRTMAMAMAMAMAQAKSPIAECVSLGEILARIFRGNETNPMRTTHRVSQSSHVVRSRLAEVQGSELQRPSEDVAGPLTGWLHAPVSHSLQSQRIVQLCSSHRMDALLAICFNRSSATLLGLSRAN